MLADDAVGTAPLDSVPRKQVNRARRMPTASGPLRAGADLGQFRQQLLQWYQQNKRDLDWRRTQDPYRIWISEIMLQQTRVAAVVPYYQRFLQRFPTAAHLARSPLDVVLRYWSGLGYYSRARNLHRAARQIVKQHDGQFPGELESVLALSGIGPYTAAAVLSMAYHKPMAVLDGNVARVLARLCAIRGNLRRAGRWKRLTLISGTLIAPDSPGDWNQAMMELGATICTPRNPVCAICPVRQWCKAHALGIASQLPGVQRRLKPMALTYVAAVFLDPRGQTLVVRGADEHSALFSNLWQFPSVRANHASRRALAQYLRDSLGGPCPELRPLNALRHTVTFRRIELAPFLVPVRQLPSIPGARMLQLEKIQSVPISNATRKIARAALDAVSK